MENARFRIAIAGGRPSGCYLLFWKGVVVYVGKSENVFTRVATHWNQMTRKRLGLPISPNTLASGKLVEFDAVELIPIPMHSLGQEELRLIQVYQPKYNERLKRQIVAPGLEETETFKELLLKKKQPLRIRKLAGVLSV
jgi:excinuclease UvrABC nuclease subunit